MSQYTFATHTNWMIKTTSVNILTDYKEKFVFSQRQELWDL